MGILRIKPIQTLFLIFFVISSAFSSGCVRNFEEENSYNIRNMDISADRIGTAFVDLNVTTYIEKYDGGATKILLFFSRLIAGKVLEVQEEVKLGVLKKGETKSVSQILSLPKNGGYNLRTILFEENKQKCDGEIEVYNLGTMPADVQDTGLEISEMDFRVRQVESGKVLVENDIYLTNEGRTTSKDLRMLVKVREMDAGLLADKIWTQTGEIKPESTVIRSVNLTMPDQYNYIVEVLIWNNDTIVKRGEGYIQLSPTVKIQDKNTTETRKIQTSEFEVNELVEETPAEEYRTEGESASGFCLALSAILICSSAIFRRRFK